MKKFLVTSSLLFIFLAAFLYIYFFHLSNTSIPLHLQGSSSDPSTFMNKTELRLSKEYSTIKDFLSILSSLWAMYILLIIIALKWTNKWERFSKKAVSINFLQFISYLFLFFLITTIATLPFDFISHRISVSYGIAVDNMSHWVRDIILNFWLSFLIGVLIISVLYFLLKKKPKTWWFFSWLLSIPFTLFLTFIQPIWIDPLFNDYTTLQNKELEKEIISMANEAGITANKVFQVNMSESTTSLNAYVSGIGENSRIVLWDTTLEKLEKEEILFIMAHEIAHYVNKDIYKNIAAYSVALLLQLYVCHLMIQFITARDEKKHKHNSYKGFSIIPLIFLIFSLLSTITDPILNVQSRIQEKKADIYAIEMTDNKEAAIRTFQELSRLSLDDVNPPFLIKIMNNSHPPIIERIEYIKEHK